jgi:hypothetical protein
MIGWWVVIVKTDEATTTYGPFKGEQSDVAAWAKTYGLDDAEVQPVTTVERRRFGVPVDEVPRILP